MQGPLVKVVRYANQGDEFSPWNRLIVENQVQGRVKAIDTGGVWHRYGFSMTVENPPADWPAGWGNGLNIVFDNQVEVLEGNLDEYYHWYQESVKDKPIWEKWG